MCYTHRPRFFPLRSSGGFVDQHPGSSASCTSSVLPQSDRASVETDSWTMNVCRGGKVGREKDGPFRPPYSPPARPTSAPRTPPLHPPGWKFLVCGPNSKFVQLWNNRTAYRFTHITNPLHTHEHQPPHTPTPHLVSFKLTPHSLQLSFSFFPSASSHPSSLPSFSVLLLLSIPFIRPVIYSLGEASGM